MERKILLNEKDMPRAWYNIQADLGTPLPPSLDPQTGEPVTPDMLEAIFPMNLIEQEVSTKRFIAIPDEVMEKLLMWRPTPLCRATGLERFLGTPAHIYYKNEGYLLVRRNLTMQGPRHLPRRRRRAPVRHVELLHGIFHQQPDHIFMHCPETPLDHFSQYVDPLKEVFLRGGEGDARMGVLC